MAENEVFYLEIKSVMEEVIRTALDLIGGSKEETSWTAQSMKSEADFASITPVLVGEATQKINSIFIQLQSENETLKARVAQLDDELKIMTDKFENVSKWKENILEGCPVFYETNVVQVETEAKFEDEPSPLSQHDLIQVKTEVKIEVKSEDEPSLVSQEGPAEDCSTVNDTECTELVQFSSLQSLPNRLACRQRFKQPKLFTCNQCDKKFKLEKSLENHLMRHEAQKQMFSCQLCDKTFKTPGRLRNHMAVHSEERPFTCATCGKGFKSKDTLRFHQKVHTSTKKYKCTMCEESFKYAHSLTVHKRKHTGDTPFVCPVCNKTYRSGAALKKHSLVHTGEKPFTCHICGARFSQKNNLKRHIRLHTGEKPFVCKDCGKSFSDTTKRKSHMLIHGARKPFMCDLCGKDFLFNCKLLLHKKICAQQQGRAELCRPNSGISPHCW